MKISLQASMHHRNKIVNEIFDIFLRLSLRGVYHYTLTLKIYYGIEKPLFLYLCHSQRMHVTKQTCDGIDELWIVKQFFISASAHCRYRLHFFKNRSLKLKKSFQALEQRMNLVSENEYYWHFIL